MEMNKNLKSFIEADKNDDTYGTEFRSIGIITMILSDDLDKTPERKLINRKKKEDFNGNKLIEDILSMFGLTKDKLLYVLAKEQN